MHRRILENSMGWNERLPKCTQRRAPPMGEKKSGTTRKIPATSSSR